MRTRMLRRMLVSTAVLALLAIGAGGAAAEPRGIPELVAPPDPLTEPLPLLRSSLRYRASDLTPAERILPRLWQRIASSSPDTPIPVIILMVEPRAELAARPAEEVEEERGAAIAHLAHELAQRASVVGLRQVRALSQFPIVFGEIEAGRIAELAADPLVRSIEDEIEFRPARAQGGAMIEAPKARAEFDVDGSGVGVAIMDTGVFPHPEFAGRYVVQGNTSASPGNGTSDVNGHGTAVAGIALGSDGGVAPGANLWSMKVLNDDGSALTSNVIQGLEVLRFNSEGFGGLHVINMSLATSAVAHSDLEMRSTQACRNISPALFDAVSNVTSAGILVVAATGNAADKTGVAAPACHPDTLAVGAVYDAARGSTNFGACTEAAAAGKIACYSNSGDKLDVLAPGHFTRTTAPPPAGAAAMASSLGLQPPLSAAGDYIDNFGGTSGAAPSVAGALALLIKRSRDSGSLLRHGMAPRAEPFPNELLRISLRRSGTPRTDTNGVTRNIINVAQAFELLNENLSPCVPSATTLCVDDKPGDRRFRVTIEFETSQAGGLAGSGNAISLANLGVNRGGLFWFFSADNPELLIKVLNGCGINQHFWIFFSAGTNVGIDLTVVDTQTGQVFRFVGPDRTPVPTVQNVSALPCS